MQARRGSPAASERSETMRNTTTVLMRFRVQEYGTWKAVFDGHEEARVRHGGIGHRILRDANDDLALTVLLEFTSPGGAAAFTHDISLIQAIRASGVEGGPHGGRYDVDYLEELDTVAAYKP
jgi:hypothetical protein